MIKKYTYQKEKKQNPYIGFTSFQHFRRDELYSDLVVKPENNFTETEHVECYPVPDYVEENVSTKVVKLIQSYTRVVDKMVWRKF